MCVFVYDWARTCTIIDCDIRFKKDRDTHCWCLEGELGTFFLTFPVFSFRPSPDLLSDIVDFLKPILKSFIPAIFIGLSVCLYTLRLSVSVCLSVYLSVCLSVCLSVRPSARLSVCLSVCPSVCCLCSSEVLYFKTRSLLACSAFSTT